MYLNGTLAEELTQLVHVSKARERATHMAEKLKEFIPQQLFDIAVQVKLGSRVLARTNIKARRKDVLAKCVSLKALQLSQNQMWLFHEYSFGVFAVWWRYNTENKVASFAS